MNAPQRTAEWLADRVGKATASRFRDVLAKVKTGEAAARKSYRVELVTERLTGAPVPVFVSAAMQWGTDREPDARAAYEAHSGLIVIEHGFLPHPNPEIAAGASPDGLVGDDGGVEIKCPAQTTVHVDTLLGGMPTEHMAQLQGAMWVTGRTWWDFVSFDPRMPERLQLHVQRIERDDAYISTLDAAVREFLADVDALEAELRSR